MQQIVNLTVSFLCNCPDSLVLRFAGQLKLSIGQFHVERMSCFSVTIFPRKKYVLY